MERSLTLRWMLWLARLEGLSFLALLLVGMPLKRLAGIPEPNLWIGWVHGLLFVVFAVALQSTRRVEGWPRIWLGWGMLGAVLPLGTFVFEAFLHRRLRAAAPACGPE